MSEKLNSGEQIQDNGELNEWEEMAKNAPEFNTDEQEVPEVDPSKCNIVEERKIDLREKERLNLFYDEPRSAGIIRYTIKSMVQRLGIDRTRRLISEQYNEYIGKETASTFEEDVEICDRVETMLDGIREKLQKRDGLSEEEAYKEIIPYHRMIHLAKIGSEKDREEHPETPTSLEAQLDGFIEEELDIMPFLVGSVNYGLEDGDRYSLEHAKEIEAASVVKDYIKIAKGETKPLEGYLPAMAINKYSPRYLELAESSLDRDAQEKIKELRKHDAAVADEIINRVAYSGKEEGKFYDVCVDKETGELLLGEDADRAREREVTRWMEGEGQRKYGEEYSKISEPIINHVEQTLDMVSELTKAVGLNGPNDYAPVLYRGRVRQNIANGFYRDNIQLVSSYGDTIYESGEPVPTSEEQEDWVPDTRLDNPKATNRLMKIPQRSLDESDQAGIQPDPIRYGRNRLRQIDLYGMPLKETKAWKENMDKLDPELENWIFRTEDMISDVTGDNGEALALIFELNRKIAEGAFNGKRVVEVQNGPGRSPFRIEDIETVSTTKDTKSSGKKKFTVKKKKLA